MGKVDTVTKQYMKKNENVADICNFYIYHGRQIIKSQDLSELDSVETDLIYEDARKFLPMERVRDVLKILTLKTDGHTVYAILGIENQTKIHYAMPVRNMIYDALTYVNQVKNTAKGHRDRKDGKSHTKGEYLSGFYKEDRLIPVITIVVYWGPEKWEGPTSLHEMFREENEEIISLINDYKIHLITPESLTDEELSKFRTNLKEVLTIIKYSADENRLDELMQDKERYASLDYDAVLLLKECIHLDIDLTGEEKVDMCKAWDDHKKRGIKEGIEKGVCGLIELCQEFGISREVTVEKVIQKFSFDSEQAKRYVAKYWVA